MTIDSFFAKTGVERSWLSWASVRPDLAVRVGLLLLLFGLSPLRTAAAQDVTAKDFTVADLYRVTNVWTVHFKFTPEQWKGMEPAARGSGPFGGPGGQRGPIRFGPSMMLAPAFLKGDLDRDGKLSKPEFQALSEQWFTDWDKAKAGKLTENHVRTGLTTSLEQSNPGPTPRGGPGGRGGGFSLQGAAGSRNGLAAAMGIEFDYVHADMEFEGHRFKDIAVRYKGNGTWMQSQGSLKRSLKVDLNEFAKGQKLAGLTKLNFHCGVTDASLMNEVLSHRLYRDAGVPAPRTAYARVFVTVPGQHEKKFFGTYSLVENIDSTFTEQRMGTKKGAIFKPVTRELFSYLGDNWSDYKQTYDPKTDLSVKESGRVIEFSKLVSNAPDEEFAARLGEFLDLDQAARFLAVTVWLSTLDSILGIGQNYYAYLHPDTRRLQFVPWDLDHSFGQFFIMGSQEQRENLSIHHPWQGENRFLERVFKVKAFKKQYTARLEEFSKSIFQPARLQRQVDEIAAAIRPSLREEAGDKLDRFEKAVAGEPVAPMGFGGFGGSMPAVKPIKGFVAARASAVTDQIAGKSEGERLSEGGFGGGGRGGRGGGRRGGPGGGEAPPGPGDFFGSSVMSALDTDKNQELTRDEFTQGFSRWFGSWNADQSGLLTDEQLRAGIDKDLAPTPGGPPRGGPRPAPPGEPSVQPR